MRRKIRGEKREGNKEKQARNVIHVRQRDPDLKKETRTPTAAMEQPGWCLRSLFFF